MDRLLSLIRASVQADVQVDERTPLLSSGLIDSMRVILLLGALEDEFDVTLDETEISAETFDTPKQIERMINAARS